MYVTETNVRQEFDFGSSLTLSSVKKFKHYSHKSKSVTSNLIHANYVKVAPQKSRRLSSHTFRIKPAVSDFPLQVTKKTNLQNLKLASIFFPSQTPMWSEFSSHSFIERIKAFHKPKLRDLQTPPTTIQIKLFSHLGLEFIFLTGKLKNMDG